MVSFWPGLESHYCTLWAHVILGEWQGSLRVSRGDLLVVGFSHVELLWVLNKRMRAHTRAWSTGTQRSSTWGPSLTGLMAASGHLTWCHYVSNWPNSHSFFRFYARQTLQIQFSVCDLFSIPCCSRAKKESCAACCLKTHTDTPTHTDTHAHLLNFETSECLLRCKSLLTSLTLMFLCPGHKLISSWCGTTITFEYRFTHN